ncbi:hypothetical protein [Epibacterium ulvae]|uniref:DUF7742 family protein n=1 Tax=Epibacterium ulvae TaxID=1156985 RepID=UPI00249112F4|nr:hypothetical protein [Epibacterium ulvae]
MMRRPVLPGDVAAVARALLEVAPKARAPLCDEIFTGAVMAMIHVSQTGQLHPRWGDGSLNAAARRFVLADEPGYEDLSYLDATQVVLDRLRMDLCQHDR